MLRTIKPKNARSKRALEAREPKEVEDARTAIFVKGTHTGEKVNGVMKDLMALKRPNAISFSKKNTVRPFEDASSLDFWSQKNDAALFLVGQSTKKRPDGLIFVRMYDYRVLDMCEVGVEQWKAMSDFKTTKATPGHKPLLHFASELFDTHPRFQQLKSILMGFFNGEEIESICLTGLEHIISISLGPTPAALTSASANPTLTLNSQNSQDDTKDLPIVHIRSYTTKLVPSGTRTPRVTLELMGPAIDLRLRRHTDPDSEILKQAMKRPKVKKQDIESGLGKKKKNMEVDDMGDLRGRIHVAKQDLGKLQTRKMKGLKKGRDEVEEDEDDDNEDEDDGGPRTKRRRDE
ncbi:rRNA-binding ribosome biosynthesis protein rpf2 [Steccherinum ochraceum]|uniref:Ribosome production factor 2 homolog n=1 Tax=Steccherinum ochraceum TaxID=92696 RepID=A0A4R0RIN6_9APHY|nr:rRNA-binding ribosome biosynthesis protein rpf2 [Steccherinum ochraceum]